MDGSRYAATGPTQPRLVHVMDMQRQVRRSIVPAFDVEAIATIIREVAETVIMPRWRNLAAHEIVFTPGLNEDLAATSVFGTQILDVLPDKNVDGVLGIWYGKGPGVDRSGDIFRHANLAGTVGALSAALVLAGDDHACKSSTIPHQSDFSLMNVGFPILYPGNVQEVLDYGLYAIALSRWSGAWAAMKMITDVCDGGGTARVDPDRLADG